MAKYTPKDRLPSADPGDEGVLKKSGLSRPKTYSKARQSSQPAQSCKSDPKPRKLLKHPGARMSANIRQEKGRELAALVLERERKKNKNRATKNLSKYHMVRFVERQKCERNLKQLKKQLIQIQESRKLAARKAKTREKTIGEHSDSDMDLDGGAILPSAKEAIFEARIEQAEIDRNYTIYAPLGEKYISLFPATGKEKISGMSGTSKSFLEPEEEAEVRRLKDDNVVRSATGERPPMWYRIQECMQNETLEQLRDGKLTAEPITLPQVGGKSQTIKGTKSTPNESQDGGVIPVPDFDRGEENDHDEQKIDGGFFEQACDYDYA